MLCAQILPLPLLSSWSWENALISLASGPSSVKLGGEDPSQKAVVQIEEEKTVQTAQLSVCHAVSSQQTGAFIVTVQFAQNSHSIPRLRR